MQVKYRKSARWTQGGVYRTSLAHLKIRRKSEVASDTEYRIKNGVANLHFHLIDCWPRILVVGDRNNAVLARSQGHGGALQVM